MDDTLYALANDDCQVRVAPSLGGSIVSARGQTLAVLRGTPRDVWQNALVRETSCYPLVRFSNRIGNGVFDFSGQT